MAENKAKHNYGYSQFHSESTTTRRKRVNFQLTHRGRKVFVNLPAWHSIPDEDFRLKEVVSDQVVVSSRILPKRPFLLVGRGNRCDFSLINKDVSSIHAVLVYRDKSDGNCPKGYYIYDIHSSNGTFLNGKLLKSGEYIHVKVGDTMQFSCSSRHYVLEGPSYHNGPGPILTRLDRDRSPISITPLERYSRNTRSADVSQLTQIGVKDGIDSGLESMNQNSRNNWEVHSTSALNTAQQRGNESKNLPEKIETHDTMCYFLENILNDLSNDYGKNEPQIEEPIDSLDEVDNESIEIIKKKLHDSPCRFPCTLCSRLFEAKEDAEDNNFPSTSKESEGGRQI